MFRAILIFAFTLAVLLPSCGKKERLAPGEILVEVERTAASKAKTPKDIQPYDEALAWHAYQVKRVLGGKLDATSIRVAHWTVLSAKAVPVSSKKGEVVKLKLVPFESVANLKGVAASDDLDFSVDEPRFLDYSQTFNSTTQPSALRYDYRGTISEQMRLYWILRGQLRAVVMGNSHATKGVNPRSIMDHDNWAHPSMLNMAPAGANNDQQCMMLREYVLQLPKLEWLLWVVSARSFNGARTDTLKHDEFVVSPGWLYDQQHRSEFWPVTIPEKMVTTDEVRQKMGPMGLDVWGSLIVGKSLLPADPEELRAMIQKQCSTREFSWNAKTFAKFSETARAFTAKGVKVLIFTTPMHPFTKEAAAVDPDGTTHEGFREMVRHMEEFDKATPGLWFRDFHKDGTHDFPPDEFYDADHLDRQGTGRLGTLIQEWMKQCEAETKASATAAK
jgi:hypothetical protein